MVIPGFAWNLKINKVLWTEPKSLPACTMINVGPFDMKDVAHTSFSDYQRNATVWVEWK